MSRTDRTETEQMLLVLLCEEGATHLYALARGAGLGPRAAEEALQRLCRDGLVEATDRGASFHCTRSGERVARSVQEAGQGTYHDERMGSASDDHAP